ncbi:multicopper oxidase family protein [Dyella terrae]|uniref:multicopper oxidase family protein n=1 Tax=Dyella terrae TaxID=522259 RepID=UPI001EFDC586|nr:multicopper oxidase domain-containing protein [Dyella terrae]ULU24859.1 multicopper oxidase domain-containing protein [Dyella terrae]
MHPSRRRFLQGMGLVAGTGALRAFGAPMHMAMHAAKSGGLCKHAVADQTSVPKLLDPSRLTPFVDPLPVPEVLRPKAGTPLRIAMRESTQRLHRDLPPTRLWTYGNTMPGPTIEARSGEAVQVEWTNSLPQHHFLPIDHHVCGAEPDKPEVRGVVHVHGARVPPTDDGYPTDWFVPGQSLKQTYPNRQDAATLWYHDHTMGIERLNLYAGLFGMYLLRDAHELSLGLPHGEQELPLVLTDRLLTEDGQLYYPVSGVSDSPWVPEVFGNVMLVNGALMPRLDVQARRYRFRVLNAANGRFFRLSLHGQKPFLQIGSDQGLLAAPVQQTSLFLAPGERADLVMDFAGMGGSAIELMTDALPLMQFKVAAGQVDDDSHLPPVLRDVPRMTEASATNTRVLTIDEYADCVAEPMLMLLDGKHWHDPVSEKPRLNSTEIWSFLNLTEDTHPIHLHLVRFQILDRRPFDVDQYLESKTVRYTGPAQPPPPHEAGWKDTAQVYPGMVTRYIITFEGYTGRYVWHCHLLEHASNEMMRPFEVVA